MLKITFWLSSVKRWTSGQFKALISLSRWLP